MPFGWFTRRDYPALETANLGGKRGKPKRRAASKRARAARRRHR